MLYRCSLLLPYYCIQVHCKDEKCWKFVYVLPCPLSSPYSDSITLFLSTNHQYIHVWWEIDYWASIGHVILFTATAFYICAFLPRRRLPIVNPRSWFIYTGIKKIPFLRDAFELHSLYKSRFGLCNVHNVYSSILNLQKVKMLYVSTQWSYVHDYYCRLIVIFFCYAASQCFLFYYNIMQIWLLL